MNKKERINGRKLNRLQTDCDMGFSKTVRPQSFIASIWQNLKHRLNLDSTIPLNFSTGTGNCLPASGRSAIRELDCEQSLFCSKIRWEERH